MYMYFLQNQTTNFLLSEYFRDDLAIIWHFYEQHYNTFQHENVILYTFAGTLLD